MTERVVPASMLPSGPPGSAGEAGTIGTTTGARQRPGTARTAGDGLKLHRRVMRLDGREYTVLTLRPGTDVRFATNHHHRTWHVLSDPRGAHLLGRLLWGLAYERHPNTLIVVDREFLVPTPFEAEPSDPIVLLPRDLTPFGEAAARALRRALPLRSAPAGTVRWRTPGLDLALADRAEDSGGTAWHRDDDRSEGTVLRRGGLLVLSAPAPKLREWAVASTRLGEHEWRGMDYVYLGPCCRAPGEVQTFRNFRSMVSSAVVARREVLAEEHGTVPAQAVRERIWHRSAEVRRRTARDPSGRRGLNAAGAPSR